jgi:hypothetical protein
VNGSQTYRDSLLADDLRRTNGSIDRIGRELRFDKPHRVVFDDARRFASSIMVDDSTLRIRRITVDASGFQRRPVCHRQVPAYMN